MAEGNPDQPGETHRQLTPAGAEPTGGTDPATTPQSNPPGNPAHPQPETAAAIRLPALPRDWEYEDPGSFDTLLICPYGFVIEQDGCCPNGCVSPWLRAGLI